VEQDFLVAFSTIPGIGSLRLRLLLEYFGSAEIAWKASEIDLGRTGLPKRILDELISQRKKIIPQQHSENLRKRGIKIVTILDKDYPERLKNISDPPNILFIKSF
jgi:DNA processing protein